MDSASLATSRLRGIRKLSEQVENWKLEVANPKRRTPLGWTKLDNLVRGPAGGEVFTMVAHSFVGKSLFATNVMSNNPDERVIFFSLEMPAHQVLHNLTAHVFDYPSRDLEQQEHDRYLPDFTSQLEQRLPFQIVIDDSGLSFDDMSAYVTDYTTYFGDRPSLIIIDYAEEVAGGKQSAEGWLRTEATFSMAKQWSRDEKLGVLMLHQSNRGVGIPREWEPPNRKSARGGGYTESDVMLGMWRPGWEPSLQDRTRQEREYWVGINVIKNRVRGLLHGGLLYQIDPAKRLVPHMAWGAGTSNLTRELNHEAALPNL